jgi:ADP-dependent NAD(P)H-hydrate dehydratase / NAD(P)H-hydrate epimerase
MTKLFTAVQVRKIDGYTIEHEPVASVDLMERAAMALTSWITKRFTVQENFKIFTGQGNNGGDGLALARLLWKKEYRNIRVFQLNATSQLSADAEINKQRLTRETGINLVYLNSEAEFPPIAKEDILIDALFGTGLTRPLEGLAAQLVNHLNNSDTRHTIAIDIPSGLYAEDNSTNSHLHIVKATVTLTFQFPKLAFFFAGNYDYVGDWYVLDIGLHKEIIGSEPTIYHYITIDDVVQRMRPRRKFSHKGSYGHALLVAGSYGMMGAAILAARATTRAGAGLVTTHVPKQGMETMHLSVPEALVSPDISDTHFSQHPSIENYTAIGIGPGLGQNPVTKQGLMQLLDKVEVPIVIDADALNLLAATDHWMDRLPGETILTPHPGEFERLFGSFTDNYIRLHYQLEFSKKYKCVVILKGAHTCITTPDGHAWFNTTGNPGMAKGGSGDVLTGIILGLITQGYPIDDASILAVYLHGLAGDLASQQMGQHGMLPSDILDNVGPAFHLFEEKQSYP